MIGVVTQDGVLFLFFFFTKFSYRLTSNYAFSKATQQIKILRILNS